MISWTNTTLGELALDGGGFIQTGPFGSQLHASDYVDEGIPCIMPVNIKENRVSIEGIARISRADANRLGKHIVKANDIIYSRRGDITLKALITEKENGYFCGTGCLLIRPGTGVNPEYLTYFLSTKEVKSWLRNRAVGITMPNLNTSILSTLPVQLPSSKKYQNEIVKVLSSIGSKIELNNKINAELEAMAKLIYDYWFVQFDFPISKAQAEAMGKPELEGKPYKASGGHMVYNKQLKREIPEGWEVDVLDNLCSRIQSGGTPKSTDSSYYSGTINWFTTQELQDEWLLKSSTRITSKAIKESSAKTFPPNTVVIAIYASPTVGRVGILSEESSFNQACCGLIPDPNSISREYLYQTLLLYRKQLNVLATGTTQKNLGVGTIKSQNIIVPNKAVLDDYQNIARPIFNKKLMIQKQNQNLSELRDWLLPMLMNGQVSIEEAEEGLSMAAEPEEGYGNG